MLDNFSSYLNKQGGKFVLSSISLLNKIIKSDIDIIKTVNILYQNGSLSKTIMSLFDMYLQPCVWYSEGGIVGLSDKNESCTLHEQKGIYNETVYISPFPSFLSQYFVFIKNL